MVVLRVKGDQVPVVRSLDCEAWVLSNRRHGVAGVADGDGGFELRFNSSSEAEAFERRWLRHQA